MEPLKDRKFVKYLLAYVGTMAACWYLYTRYILPTLDLGDWTSFASVIIYTVIIIVIGYLFINAYEAGEK